MSLFRYVEHQVKIAATAEIVNGTLYIDFSAKEAVLAHYLRLEVLSRCGGDDIWSCVTLRKPSEKRS